VACFPVLEHSQLVQARSYLDPAIWYRTSTTYIHIYKSVTTTKSKTKRPRCRQSHWYVPVSPPDAPLHNPHRGHVEVDYRTMPKANAAVAIVAERKILSSSHHRVCRDNRASYTMGTWAFLVGIVIAKVEHQDFFLVIRCTGTWTWLIILHWKCFILAESNHSGPTSAVQARRFATSRHKRMVASVPIQAD
jgi:hypothetical protein